MTTKPMSRIYEKISKAGFNSAFINKVLPAWWDDSLADTPSGKQYASLHLARVFSLSPESLKDGAEQACFNLGGNHRFKHRVNLGEEDLNVATAVAYSAARIAAENFKTPYNSSANLSWQHIRQQLLAHEKWVTLPSLIQFCHSVGIPVVFLKNFPARASKMAGLALRVAGRPVIVLTQVKPHGFMLFDLAHELGHIALGHLNDDNGGVFVDRKIEAGATNAVEAEANRFAFGVIGGREDLRIEPTRGFLTGPKLATAAQHYAEKHAIDPTHIALNYGHNLGHWGVAINALKIICAGQPTDQVLVRKLMMEGIDQDTINDDDLELLTTLCEA
ncbi:ImmA/IrrE family metallo-endopeptidase [Scandinavium sp. TWS1a]|uniref:ImmA/IrrE family metallo-endopeptidase n=1 Tax=Scandinavium tedordense TaxID=2926521 RepID=UPI0021666044|nr:ImmA/IrrE family metallo-endopeptidase [Scandinavium tedordense]MCS2172343.1 ImmA/IrrE family metallo-endopeptidase [Scandinavium tedordense]